MFFGGSLYSFKKIKEIMEFKFYVLKATLPYFMEGLLVTIKFATIAVILAILWGIFIGIINYYRIKLFSPICKWYVIFFRETPLLVHMYLIFYGLAQIGLAIPASVAGIIALVLNDGAFIAEIIRGGLQSIEKGQTEAAKSLSFTTIQTLRYFLLPQAWKKVIDSIMGMVSIILKDTSLLTLITIGELTFVAQKINAQRFEPITAFLTAGVIYFSLFMIIQGMRNLIKVMRRKNEY